MPSFLILFILFVIAIERNDLKKINAAELTFMIYASGFTLEKIAAMQEHGIRGAQKLDILLPNVGLPKPSILQGDMGKNPFDCIPRSDRLCRMVLIWLSVRSCLSHFLFQTDLPLVSVYWAYLVLRVYGVYAHSKGPSVCFDAI